jgi:hypothetical protein
MVGGLAIQATLYGCISQNKMPIHKLTMNIGGEGKEIKIIILGG